MTHKFKIWGVEVEALPRGEKEIWKVYVKSPFYQNGWKYGLNEKLFREARQRGIEKFIIHLGEGKEIDFNVPPEKYLKQKVREGEYEDISGESKNSKL